jgi:hypothetical protein
MLKFLIQQNPQIDYQTAQEFYWAGSNPYNLTKTFGQLPANRRWSTYGNYVDATGDVSDLNKTVLSWSKQINSQGADTPGVNQTKRTFSNTLTIEGQSYINIRKWLVEDISAPFNSVLVRLDDEACGSYEDWIIRAEDLSYCDDGLCIFELNLKQKDEQLSCIKRTLVADNWQGWFQNEPANGKKHPRFSYCNEQRPNGVMIMLWWLHAINTLPLQLVFATVAIGINGLIFVINMIIGVINAIIAIVGGNQIGNGGFTAIDYIDIDALKESAAQFYIETAGCGREHPAPLVRDYISNVCSKCGIRVDATTVPLFFSETYEVHSSSRGVFTQPNPYYNVCHLNAQVERGVRRYDNINPFTSPKDEKTFYLPANQPLQTLDMFLDDLAAHFNHEWKVENGTLYFYRKDAWKVAAPLYDFSGADRGKIIEGICYEFNDIKSPAYTEGIYSPDASDKPGNESMKITNGIVSHANVDLNPNFEGHREIRSKFSSAAFRLTGAAPDYIMDAMQTTATGGALIPFMAGLMRDVVAPFMREYADYALLLQDETSVSPKLLCWDGQSFLNAKCVRYQGYVSINGHAPQPNPAYNPLNSPWEEKSMYGAPNTFTKGSGLQLGSYPYGFYTVRAPFGVLITQQEALLVNYPMYFAPQFYDGLWDWFHWIDDPVRNPAKRRTWRLKMELCCEDLQKLKVLGDGSNVQIGQPVTLDNSWYSKGEITEISASYNTSDNLGKFIELKGNS